MFNKEGIPFFVIIIPFLSIVFISFFGLSYYLKISDESFEKDLNEYRILYSKTTPSLNFEIVDLPNILSNGWQIMSSVNSDNSKEPFFNL